LLVDATLAVKSPGLLVIGKDATAVAVESVATNAPFVHGVV
jgi:hypothetical protein